MIGFDFLDDSKDSSGAPDESSNMPESLEEDAAADDDSEEGVQDEPTADDESEETEDEEELEVIDLDGEEVTLKQIREWKRGNLREQDYTRKTQDLANERKAIESRMSDIELLANAFNGVEDDLKELVSDLDGIDLKQLKKEDYEEYSRLKEEREERLEKLSAIKQKAVDARSQLFALEQAELSKTLGWDDSVKREKDVKAFDDLAKLMGMSSRDTSTLTSAKVVAALVELAHLKQTKKAEPPKAKLKKVKIGKRSPSAPQSKPKTAVDRINSFFG